MSGNEPLLYLVTFQTKKNKNQPKLELAFFDRTENYNRWIPTEYEKGYKGHECCTELNICFKCTCWRRQKTKSGGFLVETEIKLKVNTSIRQRRRLSEQKYADKHLYRKSITQPQRALSGSCYFQRKSWTRWNIFWSLQLPNVYFSNKGMTSFNRETKLSQIY